MNYKLTLFGTKDTTKKMIAYISEQIGKIDLIVTIDDSVLLKNQISGYENLDQVAEKYQIQVWKALSYTLKDEASRVFFSSNHFDLGISMGWQRLIPSYILESFRSGIFGFHGSCAYLPYGRGRSPLNWSIIQGDKRFILNLFQYDEKADSPNVFCRDQFQINCFDTIRTLQYKNMLCSFQQVKKLMEAYHTGQIPIHTASNDFDFLYPKRNPEDGKIDFTRRTAEIYNLIRGVTNPFPGAFCYCGGEKVIVWSAKPFDNVMDFSDYRPGEVIDVFDGQPVVRTLDGSLLIEKYELSRSLKRKDCLE